MYKLILLIIFFSWKSQLLAINNTLFEINDKNFLLYDVQYLQNPHRYTGIDYSLNRNLDNDLLLFSLVTSSFFLDKTIRDYFQNHLYKGTNFFTEVLKGAGEPNVLYYFFMIERQSSRVIQDNYVLETMELSIQSLCVTEVLTVATKKISKRSRPRNNADDPFDFGYSGDSFFSGHSSGAWSYLTVIASRHPETKFYTYGFACLVSISRLYEDAHWSSDALVGAIVGFNIGKLTVEVSKKQLQNFFIIPYVNSKDRMVLFQYVF